VIDSHCHLADEAFVNDLPDVIARARQAGLTNALCILAAGSDMESERARRVTELWPDVRTSIGVHPHQAGDFDGREAEAAELVRKQVAADPRARAIGEIGLDYHYDFAPPATQQRVFGYQVRLARELDLPVVIHTREAEEDTLALLEEQSNSLRGVLHCFTGSAVLMTRALRLGLHISFAGIVTFPKAGELRELAKEVPADRLLCETDSPYLAPTPYRGKRNEPAWVVRVSEELATVRRVDAAALQRRIRENFETLFRP